jgi:hypothetical protein
MGREQEREKDNTNERIKSVGYRVQVSIESDIGWENDRWKDTWECSTNNPFKDKQNVNQVWDKNRVRNICFGGSPFSG